jgi:CHAT domain-containing protein
VRSVLDPAVRERKPVSRELAAALRALGSRVVSPVLAALPRDVVLDTLLVAPSGSLCGVPLDMLLVGDVKPEQPQREWPFLVASFSVAYVHSGTAFLEQRAAPSSTEMGRRLIAFADPRDTESAGSTPLVAIARGAGLGPLPFAADEALQTARFFAAGEAELTALDDARDALLGGGDLDATLRGRDFVVRLRADASERNLCAAEALAGARVLHIACHAISDLDSPELSRLMLARGESAADDDDGAVFLRDLGALDLSRTELLTLSACSTNAGKLDMYDGATGMARAGLTAGARAVLSTTWEVDDAASERLVTSFYRGWLHDKKSRVRALADAKRRAIGAGVPISTWSAFVLWDASLDE